MTRQGSGGAGQHDVQHDGRPGGAQPGGDAERPCGTGHEEHGRAGGARCGRDEGHGAPHAQAEHADELADRAANPADYWERRYAGSGPIWSGDVNATLARIVGPLPPARAIDVGCGEGGDVIWLAEQGWIARGVDLSPTAIERARRAAAGAGLPEGAASFLAGDLLDLAPALEPAELVTASFLHARIGFPRDEVLRTARDLVAPGGRMLITSHAAFPPRPSDGAHGEHPAEEGAAADDRADATAAAPTPAAAAPPTPSPQPAPAEPRVERITPADEIRAAGLDDEGWIIELAEERTRNAAHGGSSHHTEDAIVLARRR